MAIYGMGMGMSALDAFAFLIQIVELIRAVNMAERMGFDISAVVLLLHILKILVGGQPVEHQLFDVCDFNLAYHNGVYCPSHQPNTLYKMGMVSGPLWRR